MTLTSSPKSQNGGDKQTAQLHALDVFALRDSVIEEYSRFATSFTTIHAKDIREQIEKIYKTNRYWPEPLIQINASYKRSKDVQQLVDEGVLDPDCAVIFRAKGRPLSLYKHQEQAIGLAVAGENFVVTTGTGSGKSLCFFIPIVNDVLAARRAGAERRTRAIVIYPMNALANSQLEELKKYMDQAPESARVTFERYTGQESDEERKRIADNPPDILLTNFMMLELLMTRQDPVDQRVMEHCTGLRFLVLDELHTYRGRQGADVAMLVRRVRERLRPEKLVCIGTSATMASEGSQEDKASVVAGVASKLFGTKVHISAVISETLERITNAFENAESVRPKLGAAIDAGVADNISDEELRNHPLAIWVETTLGMCFSEVDGRWVRARPRTVTEAVKDLSRESGRSEDACREALRQLLLVSSIPERQRTGRADASEKSFFAFKLHQFISGAGYAYATLEPPGVRTVTVDGQQFLPDAPEKRLYAVHFCRECGHEYHPVRLVMEGKGWVFRARDIDDSPLEKQDDDDGKSGESFEGEILGFVTPYPEGDPSFMFRGDLEDYPEEWLEYDTKGNVRLKSHYRSAAVRLFMVTADGVAREGRGGPGMPVWFLPGRFRWCLRCRTVYRSAARDRTRLASLAAEGRSSATTVLVASALRWMHGAESGMELYTRKLLGFTDNRQDAALQAGHFNDFIFVSLLRAGFLRAVQGTGANGLRSEELGRAVQRALGFESSNRGLRAEWLLEPELRGVNLLEAEETLRQVLAYRVWFDQRRGWRYTNPNLEQLGMVQVDYYGLDDLAADDVLFKELHPLLRQASHDVRKKAYRELLDYMRKGLAIRCQVLDKAILEQIMARSERFLCAPWNLGSDERRATARWLMVAAPRSRESTARDMDLVLRGGSRTSLGRALRSTELWGKGTSVRDIKSKEIDKLIGDLLRAAKVYGLVVEEGTPFDESGWRINDACVVFRMGDLSETSEADKSGQNIFFRKLYESLADMLGAPMHPLFGFEAREHTAQVDGEIRVVREKRFRYGDRERQELSSDAVRIRELGESTRFLPVLFCSPTMELGVDISALNVVHMRNVPPTPANYAQRSGRAGRSGQAALVMTYASAQSPHDQYFFRDPKAMVHGEVRAPLIELANREMLDSHLQAVWLSCVKIPLEPSIKDLLVLDDQKRPLKAEILSAIRDQGVAEEARRRIRSVLELVESELTPERAPWYTGRDAYTDSIVTSAPERFEKAFDRWRELLAAAEEQRAAARKTIDNFYASSQERWAAQARERQAIEQIELLQGGGEGLSSDFYTYRYLATEGFLPGYNFPRLPLMAFIPAPRVGRGRQTYLQRPRFVALAEFGPRSLVYHEGRAFRVVRAMLSLRSQQVAKSDVQLPTMVVRICTKCGAGHFEAELSMCHACGLSLDDAEVVGNVYRIENVATYPAERISANDEERKRQGFDLQTTFEWATRDREIDVRRAVVRDELGEIALVAYGAGATITRLNKGLRRRANKKVLGFLIDPVTGYWARNDDEEDDAGGVDPGASARQRIVPCVQDRKNALLFQMVAGDGSLVTFATVQHALLRAIDAVFQLEEDEILVEPMPTRDIRKGFLFYEASEGGAGVLTRLVSEEGMLAVVARKALELMHFDLRDDALPSSESELSDQPGTACVAACYRCLMSYYNQQDHDLLDRRDSGARELLLRLARARTKLVSTKVPAVTKPSASGWEAQWLAEATQRGIPEPDAEPLVVEGKEIRHVWRKHYVAAVFDGAEGSVRQALEDLGFQVIVFGSAWGAGFEQLCKALGMES